MTKEMQAQAKEIEAKEAQATKAPAKVEAKAEVVAPKVEAKKADEVKAPTKATAKTTKATKAKATAKPVEKMVKKPSVPAPKAEEKAEKPAETAPKEEVKSADKKVVSPTKSADKPAEDKKAKALTKAKASTTAKATKPATKKAEAKEYKPWFPESFKQGDTTFVKLNKAYSYDEIVKLLEDGTDLYLACHWTKQDIKQYAYARVHGCKNPEGGVFPLDLDVCQVSHIAYLRELIDAWSVYTDAEFYFTKEAKAFDKNVWEHNDKEEVCRVMSDLPFEVYTIAE